MRRVQKKVSLSPRDQKSVEDKYETDMGNVLSQLFEAEELTLPQSLVVHPTFEDVIAVRNEMLKQDAMKYYELQAKYRQLFD